MRARDRGNQRGPLLTAMFLLGSVLKSQANRNAFTKQKGITVKSQINCHYECRLENELVPECVSLIGITSVANLCLHDVIFSVYKLTELFDSCSVKCMHVPDQ